MRYLLFAILFLLVQTIQAQQPLPDSIMKEFSRLTCECATLMKVDEGDAETGAKKLGTCINSTIGIYQENDWIKKEWLDDTAWITVFYRKLEKELTVNCPPIAKLIQHLNQKAPEPLPAVDQKYFLADAFMTAKGLEKNSGAGNAEMQRWSAKNMGTAHIQMVFDIRMVFANAVDAATYLQLKESELSEGGKTTTRSLKIYGADESKVFGENEKLLGAFGDLEMAQYNFVFRIKNVVAKVFVSASKKATYEEVLAFAKEAIGRIKAVK